MGWYIVHRHKNPPNWAELAVHVYCHLQKEKLMHLRLLTCFMPLRWQKNHLWLGDLKVSLSNSFIYNMPPI